MRATFALIAVLSISQTPADVAKLDWAAAEKNIVRLRPSAFPELPSAVRSYLEKRQCTIPQAEEGVDDDRPNNVVRGRFTSARHQDIAVLCSVNGTSTILVFRRGAAANVAELAPMKDSAFLQTGVAKIVFSRLLGVATAADMRTYKEAFGGLAPLPSPLDHEGIDDAFAGKASIVRYWFRGKWLELAGQD